MAALQAVHSTLKVKLKRNHRKAQKKGSTLLGQGVHQSVSQWMTHIFCTAAGMQVSRGYCRRSVIHKSRFCLTLSQKEVVSVYCYYVCGAPHSSSPSSISSSQQHSLATKTAPRVPQQARLPQQATPTNSAT
jgi:hypothetical protein